MIAASRVLKLRNPSKTVVRIDVFLPTQESDGAWFCRYEIDWPDEKRSFRAGGADSMQALFVAMQMIGAEIYASSYHEDRLIYLEKGHEGYGFPVPKSLRDLLVGDDKEYV